MQPEIHIAKIKAGTTSPRRTDGALALASVLALAACGTATDGGTADGNDSTDVSVSTTDAGTTATVDGVTTVDTTAGEATYVTGVASGDRYQIASSRLVLQNSKNAGLRSFAEQMIRHHQETMAQLTQIAQAAKISVPADMMPHEAQQIEALVAASRTNDGSFDRLYRQQQIAAHTEAATLHRTMGSSSDLPAGLSEFARKTLPNVEAHGAMLAEMPEPASTAA
jgi:putative membrane protein